MAENRIRQGGGSLSVNKTTDGYSGTNYSGNDKTVTTGGQQGTITEKSIENKNKPENYTGNQTGLSDKPEQSATTDIKKNEISNDDKTLSEKIPDTASASTFYQNQKIIYRETKDLLTAKKYGRINLFHNEQTTFVDKADTAGQEVYYNAVFTMKKTTAGYLLCTGKMFLYLDEILKINNIKFRVVAIKLDSRKKLLTYKLVPEEKVDLVKKFSKKTEIEAAKKSMIYGTSDSIIERMVSRKPQTTTVFSGEWKKAEIVSSSSEEKTVKMASHYPVMLDMCIEFKTEVSSLKKINARIVSAEVMNEDYFFTVELTD